MQISSDAAEGEPASPPARVPEKVLAQLADPRAFRLLGAQLHVRMSAVVPIRAPPRSAFRPHEAAPPELVVYRHVAVTEDGCAPLADAHRLGRLTALEGEKLAEDPRVSARAPGDAGRVRARFCEHPSRGLGREEIARSPDGDPHRLLGRG